MVKKILILAANPRGTVHLEVNQEIRRIQAGLRRSAKYKLFEPEPIVRLGVRPGDLQKSLREVNPSIVHFCGHGGGSEGLVFENDAGQQQLVSTEALADLFKLFANQVECVLLNACYSQEQADEIVKHINYVIGMGQDIRDDAAIAFTEGFYEELGSGETIESAYKLGCNRIQLEINRSTPEHLIPVLLKKVTPSKPMKRYALVIAVGEYQNQSFTPLPQVVNDAEAMAQALEKYGDFQVERLPKAQNQQTNSEEVVAGKVTEEQIVQAITTLVERAAKNEALIYFIGHGLQILDEWNRQQGFLATSDCELEFQGEKLFRQRNGIELEGLNFLIQSSDVSRMVMVLDCCHRGSMLNNQLLDKTFTAFSNQKEYYLIAAHPPSHGVRYNAHQHHSIFTDKLLKGLSAENTNNEGQITCHSLFEYLRHQCKEAEILQMGGGRSLTLVTYTSTHIIPTINFNHQNPYMALKAFDAEHQQYFYGREPSVAALLDCLHQCRFLAVIGASGCGKSSLVKAGLLPRLKNERIFNNHPWEIEQLTPGDNPLDILIEKLTPLQQRNQPFVLFIDQFEEVFTLCKDDEQRRSFFRLIAQEATTTQYQNKIIVAIRGDFLEQCAKYSEIADLINRTQPTTYLVEPLSASELKAAITKPAQHHGVTFEHGLVSAMVKDVLNQPGALPLLQYALWQLWKECIEKPQSSQPLLTWEGYRRIGEVGGALDSRATLLYNGFSEADGDFIQRLFLELVELGEEDKVTRRRFKRHALADMADSDEQLQKVLRELTQHRLIVVKTHKKGEDNFETYVEVAHEALLTKWKLLQGWIADNCENIRIERRFELAFQLWRDSYHKSDEALLSGLWLHSVIKWRDKTNLRLSREEKEFIRKSLEMQERENQKHLDNERRLRELAEERQREAEARAKAEADKAKAEKQRARIKVGFGLTVGVLLAGLGLFQMNAVHEKEQILKIGEVKTWTQVAQAYWDNNNQLEALMASVKALNLIPKINATQTDEYLNQLRTVIKDVREYNRLEESVSGVSVNPKKDDSYIVTANKNGTINLWSPEGKLLHTIEGTDNKQAVWRVRYSNNGELIASTGFDNKVRIWKQNDKKLESIRIFPGHEQTIFDVSFSQNNRMIASASKDGTIKIWKTDQQDDQTPETYDARRNNQSQNQEYMVNSVDFKPDDQSILAYSDNKGKVWILNRNENQYSFIGEHQAEVNIVRFSKNSKYLASGSSQDGLLIIWKKENGTWEEAGRFADKKKQIYALAFSPDNKFIAIAGLDETIKIFDLHKLVEEQISEPTLTLRGHTSYIYQLSFSSTKKQIIASASNDDTIRIWRLENDFDDSNVNPRSKTKDYLFKYSCNFLKDYLNTSRSIPSWFDKKTENCPHIENPN